MANNDVDLGRPPGRAVAKSRHAARELLCKSATRVTMLVRVFSFFDGMDTGIVRLVHG